jgi:tetratricopeptide (TPR) repeat protein
MTDPLRTDTSDPGDAASAADRDARIEQLLLAGLDHYFAGQYDHAINVWTRALFFDRSHARARAYIERARRAQAERQRESEELLHNGTIAYRSGNVAEARRLLQAALDAGAPLELAFPMLERLNQIEPMPALLSPSRDHRLAPVPAPRRAAAAAGWRISPVAAASVLVAAGIALVALVATRADWRALINVSVPATSTSLAPVVREAVLAIPTRGEMALTRARRLAAGGDLHDALSTLDLVRTTDPQRQDADELRSEIQRQLLRLDRP